MSELDRILKEISRVSNEKLDDRLKKHIIENLYNSYLTEKERFGISENNEDYIINTKPEIKNIPDKEVTRVIKDYKTNNALSINEAKMILDWIIDYVRNYFSTFGINIMNHSLDGYCELSQFLTICPLEKLGLEVTKNTAQNCFDYPLNHAFGTVNFNILENGKITKQTFLIDATYRQFFTKEKCNKGMYYLDRKPDVGYFVKDKVFASNLIKDGYVLLTKENAKKYGGAFFKVSLDLNQRGNVNHIDYYDRIVNSKENYASNENEINYENIPKL